MLGAIVEAAVLTLQGQPRQAAEVCDALSTADAGPAGWLIPVEPLLHTSAHPDAWSRTLTILRARAI